MILGKISKLSKKPKFDKPCLDGLAFCTVSVEDNLVLTNAFYSQELDSTITSCDGNKSPEPDGFSFSFLKGSRIFLWKSFWLCLISFICLPSYLDRFLLILSPGSLRINLLFS